MWGVGGVKENIGMSGFGENQGRVERFRQLHTVKYLVAGKRTKEVRMLAGGKIVAKSFDSSNRQHQKAFEREVKNLELVNDCSFIPKLLAIDRKNMTIYTRFPGEAPKQYTNELKKEVHEKIDRLRTKYKLTRTFFHRRLDGLPELSSLAIDKTTGKIKITDLSPSAFQPVTTNNYIQSTKKK
jgi:hypothetical protein